VCEGSYGFFFVEPGKYLPYYKFLQCPVRDAVTCHDTDSVNFDFNWKSKKKIVRSDRHLVTSRTSIFCCRLQRHLLKVLRANLN